MAMSTSQTVSSADGTVIAYECVGSGPALILVDGAFGFRKFSSSPELARLVRAEGRRGDAVEVFMRFVGASDEGVRGMRQSPMWSTFESVAPTLPYDAAALGDDRVGPTERAAKVNARTLVMDGGGSLEWMPFMRASAEELAAIIPHVERRTLEGQGHDVDINVLAPVLAEFIAGGRNDAAVSEARQEAY